MATITGKRSSSPLPLADTPGCFPPGPDSLPRDAAEAAWRAVVPALAGTPHARVSRDGGRTYPAGRARPLPAEPPDQPSTIPTFDPGMASGRVLPLDLDVSRGDVGHQAAEVGLLLERIGARTVADVSPSGGRHVFVPFSSLLPWRELRDLARAIALRFPAVDPAPMANLGGQISPPGSRHKSGGWRTLTTPLSEARAAVEHPNGPEVWNALLDEFAAEAQRVETDATPADLPESTSAELDDTGIPWIPRLGGRAPLGAGLEHVARTGATRGRGRSEARMAVLCAAAARGWQLADVRAAVASGAWKGFPGLYHRVSEPGRLERLLPLEWRKAIGFAAGEKNVRGWHTSDLNHAPPAGESLTSAEYGHIRRWVTACDVALEDPGRVKGWGGRVIAVRLVLLALAQAAMVSGSSTVEFGVRNLALHSALSSRTVARVLRLLRDEDDPLIDLVSPRRLARADRYELRIPARYADSARWRRRRAGRIAAAHPVFLVLGGMAALVYQELGADEARNAELARAARLAVSTASAALRVLAGHGLAVRGRGGWKRGPADLDAVAESTGAADLHRERAERYRQDREGWRARLRQYASTRNAPVAPGDGWWPLDDEDEWTAMLFGRWPVHRDDITRAPPAPASAAAAESA